LEFGVSRPRSRLRSLLPPNFLLSLPRTVLSLRCLSTGTMQVLQLPAFPILFALLFHSVLVSTTCYFPDGSIQDTPAFVACDQTVGSDSMCCGTNWTANNPKVANDKCEVNGLCLNSDNGAPLYWRGSCTDPTWKSPFCIKNLCTEFSVRKSDPSRPRYTVYQVRGPVFQASC
jgi:hypothetical protein